MVVLGLRILGGFEARRSSGDVAEIPIRKGQALLAFLALNPGGAVARSRLAGLLWGDRGEAQARASLRQTLTVLRKALRPVQDQVLRADRQTVGVDAAAVEVDALSFQGLVASGTPADLETAVSLYGGDLLDGLDLAEHGYQTWLEDERRRFHDLMVEALTALMAHRHASGAPQTAVALGQRLLALEPLREDVHRALMVLYAELGQRHAARAQYRRCRELLKSELDVAPEAETEAVYRTLLGRGAAGDDPAEGSDGAVAGTRESGDGVEASRPDRTGPPPRAVADGSRRPGRRDAVIGRALLIGGMAALVWLIPWPSTLAPPAPPAPTPPDRVALQRPDLPALSAPSLGAPWSVPDGATRSPAALLHRVAFPLSGGPAPVMPAVQGLAGVRDGVSRYTAGIAPAETASHDEERRGADEARAAMQRAADRLWPGLSDSWDLRALRAFRARYPGARQAAEAGRRVAFLARRQREAQAELNRLGYGAGPTDGIWGSRSARAMRAFQSDHGLAPDGTVSEAVLRRLKDAAPTMTAPSAPTPTAQAPQSQPSPAARDVVALLPSARTVVLDVGRWTASGSSPGGPRILATATRRGDVLKVVFEIDHGHTHQAYRSRYTQSCTIPATGAAFECWITGRPNQTLGANVSGRFPQLRYSFRKKNIDRRGFLVPRDIVLDFRPEARLAVN